MRTNNQNEGSVLFAKAVFPGVAESQLIQDFFQGKTGIFVDVGGNFPETSVSTPLEERGWTGIVIEPQPDCCEALRGKRTSSIVQCACVSQKDLDSGVSNVRLWLAGPKSSVERTFIAPRDRTEDFIDVVACTLNQVLREHGINNIDLLSIDTEGTEISVMGGLDWSIYQPTLILLEDHARDFKKHRFMTSLGYKLFRRTGFNSWYAKPENALSISLLGGLQLFRKYILSMPFRNLRRWRHQHFG